MMHLGGAFHCGEIHTNDAKNNQIPTSKRPLSPTFSRVTFTKNQRSVLGTQSVREAHSHIILTWPKKLKEVAHKPNTKTRQDKATHDVLCPKVYYRGQTNTHTHT